MNHCVPDFEMDDDYSIPTSSAFNTNRSKKSAMQEDEIMELLWQNGQVVMQSQTQQRSIKNGNNNNNNKSATPPSSKLNDAVLPTEQHQNQPQQQQQHHLFMQEDEMASWLHYPLSDCNFIDSSDFCADLIYNPNPNANPTPCVTSTTNPPVVRTPQSVSSKPPIPPPPPQQQQHHQHPHSSSKSAVQNFAYFSRHKAAAAAAERPESESGPSNSKTVAVKESTTVVDSSDTPRQLRGGSGNNNNNMPCATMSCGGAAAVTAGTSSNHAGREVVDVTVTSSPGGSSASAEPTHKQPSQTAEIRKRKGRENAGDDAECHSEDVEFESAGAKKQTRGSTSTKRSRAAEVHNLSERRRRDRINEKMRALQELIPRCNKSDKASMLDEAIEYLKSLQLQVQMMSMGCGMVPMMFPGVQQYMAPMGMGFGMAMGMDMGMTRPMMPFPNALGGSAMPSPSAAAHLGPRFPMPAFHMPPVPAPDPSRVQATNQSDPSLNPFGMQNPNQQRIPNFADPHQQYIGLHQMQLPVPQHQTMAQPSASKPSNSKGAEDIDNHQSGT